MPAWGNLVTFEYPIPTKMHHIAIFASGSGTNAENIARYFQDNPSIKVSLILANKPEAFVLERAEKQEGDYFQIASYESLDALKGAGNSSEKRQYEFIDNSVFNNITYWYRLIDVSMQGVRTVHPVISATPLPPIIDAMEDPEKTSHLPAKFELYQNYPNPFNPRTMINYQLPMIHDVELVIYNQRGQEVLTLFSGIQSAGKHRIEWDATGYSSGIYYYRLAAGNFVDVKRMILMR